MSLVPIVRVEEAGLGMQAHVRLVVSRVSDLRRLRAAWASSGAALEWIGDRLHATTTVDALARAAGRSLGAEEAASLERILREAITAWIGPAPPLRCAGVRLETGLRPLVVGVVNVTPDSFADGGRIYPESHPEAAITHGLRLLDEGADVLDVGGESTRPGSRPVGEDEELRRVIPVVEGLADAGATCSIDTRKPGVALAALQAGAVIVNDVSGAADERLLEVAAAAGAGYVLMHTRGMPDQMQRLASYSDVVAEVYEFLSDGLARCVEAGILPERILIDPGLGFAKTPEHNLALLRSLRQFRGLGRPVLVGASRKSFLGPPLGGGPEPCDRLEGSLACATAAVLAGAAGIRVHDVAATVRVARVARALATGRLDWPESHAQIRSNQATGA
ncbi:MAG: dihydropteroate synthase [Egibacteraceae bacterium]